MTDKKDQIRAAFDKAEDVTPDEQSSLGPGQGRAPSGDGYSDSPPPADHGPPDGIPEPEVEGAKLTLNDTGNGHRFALYCGDDAMFVPRVGWHVWDTMRWKLDPDGIAVRGRAQTIHEWIEKEIPHLQLNAAERRRVDRLEVIRASLRDMGKAYPDLSDDERAEKRQSLLAEKDKLNGELWGRGSSRQRHKAFARSAGNSGSIKNLLMEATTSLHRDVDDLDADPLTVNTRSGLLRFNVIDMREEGGGKQADVILLPHERIVPVEGRHGPQYITKLMPVQYDPDATCPKFDRFLAKVQPDPQMRAFLQRWFGLSMTAEPVQKVPLHVWHGCQR